MSEMYTPRKIFDENNYQEIEQKFTPVNPARLEKFRRSTTRITQIYLSHPSEEFSLRLRRTHTENAEPHYSATLKNRGVLTDTGLARLEVETDITPEMFDFYNQNVPEVHKARAEPHPDIVVDFFDDGHSHAESENPAAWLHFLETSNLAQSDFMDTTGHYSTDNEWRAHYDYMNRHRQEAFPLTQEISAKEVALRAVAALTTGKNRAVVAITGRSGSGKSTLVNSLQDILKSDYDLSSVVVSTDNYNVGSTRLREISDDGTIKDYDGEHVYDLATFSSDISRLQQGNAIPRRLFNFVTEEPSIDGTITPKSIIITEGIHAAHTSLAGHIDYIHHITTPLATAVGRRILRDIVARPRFSPEENLRYTLEFAEPAYRKNFTVSTPEEYNGYHLT